MPFITREDGEHFVIPSYREVISAGQKSTLKKEVISLSHKYGEYLTLHEKASSQYELAFSPDIGYLLGESIWSELNKPDEMIYCEAIPNTTEAILVIVKSGSVYLDGSFQLDSITEELVIFLTQQNHFEIFTYGDVPISEYPQEGKFSFEASSVKAYKKLENPIFPTLPLKKQYKFQLVQTVLTEQGIGVLPIKQLIIILVVAVGLYFGYGAMTKPPPEAPPPPPEPEVNPYQPFIDALSSPAPDVEMKQFLEAMPIFFTMPGWEPTSFEYHSGQIEVDVQTQQGKIAALQEWAKNNDMSVDMDDKGFLVTMNIKKPASRSEPKQIYSIENITANLIDSLANVYPGNHINADRKSKKSAEAADPFKQKTITISVESASPVLLDLIRQQLKGLPLVLKNIKIDVSQGKSTGTITMDILGN